MALGGALGRLALPRCLALLGGRRCLVQLGHRWVCWNWGGRGRDRWRRRSRCRHRLRHGWWRCRALLLVEQLSGIGIGGRLALHRWADPLVLAAARLGAAGERRGIIVERVAAAGIEVGLEAGRLAARRRLLLALTGVRRLSKCRRRCARREGEQAGGQRRLASSRDERVACEIAREPFGPAAGAVRVEHQPSMLGRAGSEMCTQRHRVSLLSVWSSFASIALLSHQLSGSATQRKAFSPPGPSGTTPTLPSSSVMYSTSTEPGLEPDG